MSCCNVSFVFSAQIFPIIKERKTLMPCFDIVNIVHIILLNLFYWQSTKHYEINSVTRFFALWFCVYSSNSRLHIHAFFGSRCNAFHFLIWIVLVCVKKNTIVYQCYQSHPFGFIRTDYIIILFFFSPKALKLVHSNRVFRDAPNLAALLPYYFGRCLNNERTYTRICEFFGIKKKNCT